MKQKQITARVSKQGKKQIAARGREQNENKSLRGAENKMKARSRKQNENKSLSGTEMRLELIAARGRKEIEIVAKCRKELRNG